MKHKSLCQLRDPDNKLSALKNPHAGPVTHPKFHISGPRQDE